MAVICMRFPSEPLLCRASRRLTGAYPVDGEIDRIGSYLMAIRDHLLLDTKTFSLPTPKPQVQSLVLVLDNQYISLRNSETQRQVWSI